MYAKASCNFVAAAVIAGEEQLVGVECKACVTPRTDRCVREHALFLSCFHNISTTTSTTNELYIIVYMQIQKVFIFT